MVALRRIYEIFDRLENGRKGSIIFGCPFLSGCVSQGKSREESIANIPDTIHGNVRGHQHHGLPISAPLTVEGEVST
jgi:predicted RNase H-like HicB family nuclease